MLFFIHYQPVVDLIGEDDELMLSCHIDNLLEHLFWIKRSGRIIRIDDNDGFRPVRDLLSDVVDIRIPLGLFIAATSPLPPVPEG